MLVVTRQSGETLRLILPDGRKVTLLFQNGHKTHMDKVRLKIGIEAPRDVVIERGVHRA